VARANFPLLFAQVEHRAWLMGLQDYLTDGRSAPPPLKAELCHIGAWLQAGGLKAHPDPGSVAHLVAAHQRVHALATHLCELKAQGQGALALAQSPQLLALRDTLLAQLRALLPPT
jgi:hypothetical protein